MIKVHDRDMGMERIFNELRSLNGAYVKVGIQAGTTRTDPGKGTSDMVTVAAAHEFGVPAGSPDKDIPERSFMRSTFEEKRENLAQAAAGLKDQVFQGNLTAPQAADQLGLLHVSQIQAKIRSNIPPPLSPETIRRKGNSVALIDTSQMIDSVRHVVVMGGKS